MISRHRLTETDVCSAGHIVKSLTLSHKMVCQTLVTAITPAPLMGSWGVGGVPPQRDLPGYCIECLSASSSTVQWRLWRGDFIHARPPHPFLLMSATVRDVKALRRKQSEERLFKWTCRSKVVVAGAREWLDWLRHSASCRWNQNDFPNSGEVGKINCWFAAKWTAARIWSEVCLCCYFISAYLCDSYQWGSLLQ